MKAHQRLIREHKQQNPPIQSSFLNDPVDPSLKNTTVKQIDYKTASKIILEYEWIGTMPLPKSCRYMFGIYFEGVLGGAVVYVEPSTRQFNQKYPRRVVQLNRGATAYWTPKNTASKLIGASIKILRQENILAIIAYCTQEAGEIGTIYQACNFMYIGQTAPSKTYFLDNHWVSERTLADKKKWARNKSPEWISKFENLPQKQLKGKFKYVYLLGTKKENEQFMTDYKITPQNYPKRLLNP